MAADLIASRYYHPAMVSGPSQPLSEDHIADISARATEAAERDEKDTAWQIVQPLMHAMPEQPAAAIRLLKLVEAAVVDADRALTALEAVEAAYPDHDEILGRIGEASEGAADVDELNRAPPTHPFFTRLVEKLAARAASAKGQAAEERLWSGLATAARMCARQHDDLVARSYQRLVELDPTYSPYHYNYGLFLKTRGRFKEGIEANRDAIRLSETTQASYEWNLGICATGAGESRVALDIWKGMDQRIELGRFDLPEGPYPDCKVKVAERPLAERTAATDDPGLEETIWIERLSPCHGIVRSVLYGSVGVDYGDVILHDGAPITYHTYGDKQVPVFPHLATLRRQAYRLFDFGGTQDAGGQIESINPDLPEESIVYAHTERYQVLCDACWRAPDVQHERHEESQHYVVTGRIAVAPDIDLGAFVEQLDRALAERPPCRIYAPQLCRAAGLEQRAEVEARRFALLRQANT